LGLTMTSGFCTLHVGVGEEFGFDHDQRVLSVHYRLRLERSLGLTMIRGFCTLQVEVREEFGFDQRVLYTTC